MKETLHLLSSRNNAKALYESIDQTQRGELLFHETFE
jgi:PHD/YefM family antitoxin component YafN of YafNO toxin-antitoxin module